MTAFYVLKCCLHSSDNMKNILVFFIGSWINFNVIILSNNIKTKKNRKRKELSYNFVLRMYLFIEIQDRFA